MASLSDSAEIPPPAVDGRVVQLFLGTEGGGIITAVKAYGSLLRDAGWVIDFVSLSPGRAVEMLENAGLSPTIMPMGKLRRYRALARAWRDSNTRIVHVHNPSAHLIALANAKRAGAKVCRTVHGDVYHEMRATMPGWKFQIWKFILPWMLNRTDVVQSVSPHLIPLMPGRFLSRERILVKPNGYDASVILNDLHEIDENLAHWLGDSPLALSMGRMIPLKNYPLLVRAFALTQEEVPNAKLIIAGSGPREHEIGALVRGLGLTGSVRLLPWVHNIAPLLKRATVVVLSSTTECCPMLVLEGMCVSKPIVSTAVGGIPFMIEDGVTGRLAEEDPAALGAALAEVLSNSTLAASLGEAGFARLKSHFTHRAAARRTALIYNGMLSGRQIGQNDLDAIQAPGPPPESA